MCIFILIQTLSALLVKKTNFQLVIYAPAQVTNFAHINCDLIREDRHEITPIPTSQKKNPEAGNTFTLLAAPYNLKASMNNSKMSQYPFLLV